MKLAEYRKKYKKTQKEMADFLAVPLIVYCSWEQGKRHPSSTNVMMILEKTNGEVKPNDLYGVANESN